MIVICEECGKKYRIDPERIKGKEGRFRCKACGHIVRVVKPEPEAPEITIEIGSPSVGAAPESRESPGGSPASDDGSAEEKEGPEKGPAPAEESGASVVTAKTRKGPGLRLKMFLLFFLIPMVLIAAAGLLYLRQMQNLSTLITRESTAMVKRFAERAIAEKAHSVAAQVQLSLKNRKGLKKTQLNDDPAFRAVAVQKVGKTGYTALYERPGKDGVWRTWVHVNPKIIGIDMSKLKKPLGENFPGFWRVYTGVRGGSEAKGYYTWRDKDGAFRDKFMVCTPVPGTRFVVAATTYLDEFTKDVSALRERARSVTERTKQIVLLILGCTLVLVGAVVSLYGHALTRKIRTLTDVAERISVGELEAEIPVRSGDEIGALAEAIERMQESIRLSIERLRRRR